MRNLPLTLAFCLFIITPLLANIDFKHISLEEALNLSKSENKPIFIDVYATWCGPCKSLAKSTFTDEELGELMNANFINIKIDGETEEGELLMSAFDLNSYPTMIFINSDMDLLDKIVGFVDAQTVAGTAHEVLHPESSIYGQLISSYNAGERDRELMRALIEVSVEKEKPIDELSAEFMELFPDLDLTEENEFIVFIMASDSLGAPFVDEFLDNANEYAELFPEFAQVKMANILKQMVVDAYFGEGIMTLNKSIDRTYTAYKTIFSEEFYSKKELKEMLGEALESIDEE